jgi:hypothetical protein
MEVSGQLHAQGKELLIAIGYEAGWAGRYEEEKNVAIPGIEPGPSSP